MLEEKIVKIILEREVSDELERKIDQLNAKFDLILSLLVAQQKNVSEALGVTADTLRNRVVNGEIDVLQKDGSRLNYFVLKSVADLKVRKQRKRKR